MKSTTIEALIAHITNELTPIDIEARFDAFLDECYSFDKVGGPFENMTPSRVLREVDPTAHRCGVSDFSDGEPWVEIDGDYYEQDEVEEAKAEFIAECEEAITGLEMDIESELEPEVGSEGTLEEQLTKVRAELAELEAHSF